MASSSDELFEQFIEVSETLGVGVSIQEIASESTMGELTATSTRELPTGSSLTVVSSDE